MCCIDIALNYFPADGHLKYYSFKQINLLKHSMQDAVQRRNVGIITVWRIKVRYSVSINVDVTTHSSQYSRFTPLEYKMCALEHRSNQAQGCASR